jgi:Mn2+/Fe2+ NRAMP family transporter
LDLASSSRRQGSAQATLRPRASPGWNWALPFSGRRWQLATGQTILEGTINHLRWPAAIAFIVYFLPWSFFVGGALISACGVTLHAMTADLGLFQDPARAKLVLGGAQSLVAIALVWRGGFRLFQRVMVVCVVAMFVTVVATAFMMRPAPAEMARGLFVPTIPRMNDGGLTWTIALMGGVGGTLTTICYGYWIREIGRTDERDLRASRIDLGVGFALMALFSIAIVVIVRGLRLEGSGAGLIVLIADHLHDTSGPGVRWIFLVGAWATVFSSLLGTLQAVPYIFTDFMQLHRAAGQPIEKIDTRSWLYRGYLLALGLIPLLQVQAPFREVQKYYAVLGAAFIPMLAVVLLLLNSRTAWIGPRLRNRPTTNIVLVVAILLFVAVAAYQVIRAWS